VGSLTGDNAPKMQVGEKMRIYFINEGLNLASNFHPIGSHWDKVWSEGALLNNPLRGSQTTLVPAGGSTIVELDAWVPMTVVLVDHALARAFDKGAIGQIVITGDPDAEIFEAFGTSGSPAPDGVVAPPAPLPEQAPAPDPPAAGVVDIVPGAFLRATTRRRVCRHGSPADYSINT
jgi:nitrite reductase (NO-forming)